MTMRDGATDDQSADQVSPADAATSEQPPMTDADEGPAEVEVETIDVRKIVIQLIVAIVVIVAAATVTLILFEEELLALSELFVETLGGFGVALGFFLPDAFTVPLPNDAFTFLAYMSGQMPFWECVMWGTLGSLVGGTTGFYIGRSFQRARWFRRIMSTRGHEVSRLVRRYGKITLLIAALAPIPYSLACWAVGAGGMRFRVFFAISLVRFVKIALYLWLLAKGVLSTYGAAT